MTSNNSKPGSVLVDDDQCSPVGVEDSDKTEKVEGAEETKVAGETYKQVKFRTEKPELRLLKLYYDFLAIFPFSCYLPGWQTYEDLKLFITGSDNTAMKKKKKTLMVILDQIHPEDSWLFGLRSFLCLYFCQLDPVGATKTFKGDYQKIYWVFCRFILSAHAQCDTVDYKNNKYAAVNLSTEGKLVGGLHFGKDKEFAKFYCLGINPFMHARKKPAPSLVSWQRTLRSLTERAWFGSDDSEGCCEIMTDASKEKQSEELPVNRKRKTVKRKIQAMLL
jgi:hypothetical protein